MNYFDLLNVSQDAKDKIGQMGLSSEEELVSTIRASEDACRNHLGTDVVDVILAAFKAHDKGKFEGDLPKMGLLIDEKPPVSSL